MRSKNYYKILQNLESKSFEELSKIANEFNIDYKNKYKSKSTLIKKIQQNDDKILFKVLNIKSSPFYKSGLFWTVFGVIVSVISLYFAFRPPNLINQLVKAQEMNRTFLSSNFTGGYKIFGAEKDQFIYLEDVEGHPSIKSLNSKISFNPNIRTIQMTLNGDDIIFNNVWLHGNTISTEFRLGRVSEFILIPGFYSSNLKLYFVRLNEDIVNPVFAIGLRSENRNF